VQQVYNKKFKTPHNNNNIKFTARSCIFAGVFGDGAGEYRGRFRGHPGHGGWPGCRQQLSGTLRHVDVIVVVIVVCCQWRHRSHLSH